MRIVSDFNDFKALKQYFTSKAMIQYFVNTFFRVYLGE
jgi:hypothetical protein